MGQFREGYIDILVATDLAARGLDVKEISYVVIITYLILTTPMCTEADARPGQEQRGFH